MLCMQLYIESSKLIKLSAVVTDKSTRLDQILLTKKLTWDIAGRLRFPHLILFNLRYKSTYWIIKSINNLIAKRK